MYFSRERLPWVRVEVKAGLLLMRNSKGYRVNRWLDWLKIRFVTQLTRHDQNDNSKPTEKGLLWGL